MNISFNYKKMGDFQYELELPPTHGWNGVKEKTCKVKLAMTGNKLVVRKGGGYESFLEFLHKKGVLT